MQRHIFVADTDAEAKRFGKPAMELHLAQLNWLRAKHGRDRPDLAPQRAARRDFEDCVADGTVIAGTPEPVRAEIERQVASSASTICSPICSWATMTLADALRSLQLFSTEVMPKLGHL